MSKKMAEEEGTTSDDPKIPDIYLLFRGYSFCRGYAITPSTSSSSTSSRVSLKPVLPPLPKPIVGPRFASLGSKIYAAGGSYRPPEPKKDSYRPPEPKKASYRLLTPNNLSSVADAVNEVYYIDTRCLEQGWKVAAPMKVKRMFHYMMADAGKIYVFGGTCPPNPVEPTKFVYAEVYDPKLNKWEELAHIERGVTKFPQIINGHGVVVDDQLHRKILFHAHFDKSLFYLNTSLKEDVGIYDDSFGQNHPQSVFLDGVFYFISRNRIYVYDVVSRKVKHVVLCNVRKNTLPRYGWDEPKPICYLLSLGNKYLALIWAILEGCITSVDVHCSVIEMSNKGKCFEGMVLNCSTYSVQSGRLERPLAVCYMEDDVDLDTKLGQSTKSSNVKLQQHKRKREDEV